MKEFGIVLDNRTWAITYDHHCFNYKDIAPMFGYGQVKLKNILINNHNGHKAGKCIRFYKQVDAENAAKYLNELLIMAKMLGNI